MGRSSDGSRAARRRYYDRDRRRDCFDPEVRDATAELTGKAVTADEPFPHVSSTAEFRETSGMDTA
jgi:hypothetical protein